MRKKFRPFFRGHFPISALEKDIKGVGAAGKRHLIFRGTFPIKPLVKGPKRVGVFRKSSKNGGPKIVKIVKKGLLVATLA